MAIARSENPEAAAEEEREEARTRMARSRAANVCRNPQLIEALNDLEREQLREAGGWVTQGKARERLPCAILLRGEVGQRTGRPKVVPDKNDIPSAADLGLTRNPVRARAAWLRTRFPPRYPPVFHRLYSACLQALPVGNLQTCTVRGGL